MRFVPTPQLAKATSTALQTLARHRPNVGVFKIFRAGGADARLMRRLADQRRLTARDVARASVAAQALLQDWFEAGWLHNTLPSGA